MNLDYERPLKLKAISRQAAKIAKKKNLKWEPQMNTDKHRYKSKQPLTSLGVLCVLARDGFELQRKNHIKGRV